MTSITLPTRVREVEPAAGDLPALYVVELLNDDGEWIAEPNDSMFTSIERAEQYAADRPWDAVQ